MGFLRYYLVVIALTAGTLIQAMEKGKRGSYNSLTPLRSFVEVPEIRFEPVPIFYPLTHAPQAFEKAIHLRKERELLTKRYERRATACSMGVLSSFFMLVPAGFVPREKLSFTTALYTIGLGFLFGSAYFNYKKYALNAQPVTMVDACRILEKEAPQAS